MNIWNKEYCDDHNQRFAIDAASETDFHLPIPGAQRLREIFRLETERVLGNDWESRMKSLLSSRKPEPEPYAGEKQRDGV